MTNPGIYQTTNCVKHFVKAICGPQLHAPDFPTWSFVVFGVLAVCGLSLIVVGTDEWEDLLLTVGGVMLSVSFCVAGCGIITYNNAGGTSDPQAKYSKIMHNHEAHYQARLIEWLSSEYGITVNERGATSLMKGEDVAATFNDHDVVIDLVPDASGNNIAVRQAGGQLLTPTR